MKERVYYFDFLNVIACMAMLALEQRLLPVEPESLLYRVGFIPFNYLLCFGIVYVTKRIPMVGRYVFP